LEDRNANIPEDHRIRFRIGINLGDIIIDEGDLFGDGVNVAARLEALAEPGEICVSASVRERSAKSCRSGSRIGASIRLKHHPAGACLSHQQARRGAHHS